MPGPPPNPDARRTNRRHAGFMALPEEGRAGDAPPLPDTAAGEMWEPDIVEAWSAWWASPMATQWVEGPDTDGLALALAHLQHAVHGDLDRAREYRLMSDRFGLSPLSRLRLRWMIGDHPDRVDEGHPADGGGEVVALRAVPDDG